MGLFDKAMKTAQNVGSGVMNTATNVGSNVGTSVQDNSEVAALKMQINTVDQELDAAYTQVGRKYVDYVAKTGEMPGIDISDLLKLIDPKLARKEELEKQLIEVEKRIKESNALRDKARVEEEFLAEKEKLDKALAMDVISQEDYDAKISIARKKVDNFEELRKVDQQFEMGIITKEEKEAKIKALTE